MTKLSFIKKTKYFLEFVPLYAGVFLFSLLPWKAAIGFGCFAGRMASYLVSKRFKLTIDNLTRAFPEKSPAEIEAIARDSWENIGRIAAEFLKLSESKAATLAHCRVENDGELKKWLATGKGALLHSAHITNWEAGSLIMSAAGYNFSALSRITRNPFVENFLFKRRTKFGTHLISHRQPFFACVKALKKGRALTILMDQNMPAGDLFLPVFNRVCAVTPITALLSLKTGTPVFPARLYRDGHGVIVAQYEPAIFPPEHYSEEGVLELVNRLNAATERWIRAEPAMWLWSHNRWKRENDPKRFAKKEETEIA